VAALLAAIGIALLFRQRGQNRALAFAAVTACLAVGLIGFGFLQAGAVHATADAAAMGRADEVSSLSGRLPLWDALLHDVGKEPLMGFGYGGYWTAKKMRDLSKRLGWHIPHAHNGFIEMMLAGGVVLLCIYLLWILAAAATSFVRFQKSNRPADLFLACFVAFSLVNDVAESKFPESTVFTQIMYTAMAAMALRKTVPRDVPRRAAPIERPWRLPQRAAQTA
jgi:O-antigen ligase